MVGGVEITGARIIIGAAAVKIDLVRKRRIIIGAATVRIVLILVLVFDMSSTDTIAFIISS